MTPTERQAAEQVNALGLPVTIHIEDEKIPLPVPYQLQATAGGGEVKEEFPDGGTLWRTETDGELANWLSQGFTPRAGGVPPLDLDIFAIQTPKAFQLRHSPVVAHARDTIKLCHSLSTSSGAPGLICDRYRLLTK